MKTVSIEPTGQGWAVISDLADNAMIFRSGAKAEDAALRLARALSESGDMVQIKISLRDGASTTRVISQHAR